MAKSCKWCKSPAAQHILLGVEIDTTDWHKVFYTITPAVLFEPATAKVPRQQNRRGDPTRKIVMAQEMID